MKSGTLYVRYQIIYERQPVLKGMNAEYELNL